MAISHRLTGDNIFDLDPINTKLTAPVSNVSVQKPQDNTTNENRVSAGLSSLSDAFTKIALKKQANQIHNDIITAKLAAAYEQEMPGGLEPEAQLAYSKAVDTTTKGKVLQHLQDFFLVEGSTILHDDRVDRKTRMTTFTNQLLGILNTGKASISRVNAAEMFGDLDLMYGKLIGKANVEIAKDKQQESLGVAANSISQITKEHLAFMEDLKPKVSDTNELGTPLSPAEYAQKVQKFNAEWYGKHINSKWFKAVVKETARTNLGVSVEDIKATALTIVSNELLKKLPLNPDLLDQRLMSDILNNVKGSTEDSTLQDEINSNSDFGKVLDTIKKGHDKKLKAAITALDKDRKAQSKAQDDRVSNYVLDNMKELGKVRALEYIESINDPTEQRAMTKFINTQYSNENKKDIGHPDFGPLVKYGAENFYNVNTEKFDKVGFYAYAGNLGFKATAIEKASKEANPQTAIGKHRKDFLDNVAVKTLIKQFPSTIVASIKQGNLRDKLQIYLDRGMKLDDPMSVHKLIQKVGGGVAGSKIRKILNAEVLLSHELETLVRHNPDKPVYELVPEAVKIAQSLIEDTLKNLELGETYKSMKGKVKTDAEPKEVPELETAVGSKVQMLDTKKGLFSFDAKPREAFIKQAETELEAYDKAQQELTKIRKEFKVASVAKRASIIAAYGDNPENLTVPSEIRDIARIVNPDPAVRRHLATLHLSGLKKIEIGSENKFADDRELKLTNTYNPWNSFKNFIKALPKKTAEAIKPTAQAVAEAIQPTAKSVSKVASAGVAAITLSTSQLDPKNVEYVLKNSGATKIKQGRHGVESLKDVDDRLLAFTKTLFDDKNLQDVWGDEKVITSARRTPKNKYHNEKSGHSKGKALDVRIDGWKGTPKDLLLKKLKPSVANAGWTIVSSKAGKEYVVVKKKDSSKTQYWMKLTKGKETNFIEVVGGDQPHIHYHIDENNLEPGGKW